MKGQGRFEGFSRCSPSVCSQRRGSPPPKDAWLSAILSKAAAARQLQEARGWPAPASQPSQLSQQRATYRPMEMAPRTEREEFESRQERPSSAKQQREWMEKACATQARLDEHALRNAFTRAVQEMVVEQDCCFIAKGLCHLCGVTENHVVPVVNFCPDGNPGHSLCREHLRSIYRVRTEDLFAGKNRPMASRRALKCMVCSLSCPCSMCVHEKNHEINRYRRQLLEENERFRGGNGRPAYFSNRNTARQKPEALEIQDDDDGGARQVYAAETHQAMHAEEKATASNENQTPTGSAKDGLPQGVLAPRSDPSKSSSTSSRDAMRYLEEGNRVGRGPEDGAAPSPSAAHVLNCAESEKSLVELLTTLNQSAGPGMPEDNRRQRYNEATDANRSGSYGDRGEGSRKRDLVVNTRLSNDESDSPSRPPSRHSGRAAKRKRDSDTEDDENYEDDDDDDDDDEVDDDDDDGGYELVESPGGTLTSSRSRKPNKLQLREDYSSEDDAPLRPPRSNTGKTRPAKKAAKGQARSKGNPGGEVQPAKKLSPASRKRKPSLSEQERTPSADRKNPRNSKSPATKPHHASKKHSEKGKLRHHHSDDDDSDIDTNLDYCEVCLTMGDLVCCDVCPRSFHLSCLGMKERDLPEGDWQCNECKKPSHFIGFARKVESQPSAFAKIVQIVKCLQVHPYARAFLKPVEDVPNYKDIVEQPMDLSTVMSKLKRNAYAVGNGSKGLNLDAFANDIRLIWGNCKLFNDDGSGITRAADELAAGFEDLLNLVKKKALSPLAAETPPRAVDVENQSVNRPTRDKSDPHPSSPAGSNSPESEKEKTLSSNDNIAPKIDEKEQVESPRPSPSGTNKSLPIKGAEAISDAVAESDEKAEAGSEKAESPSGNAKD